MTPGDNAMRVVLYPTDPTKYYLYRVIPNHFEEFDSLPEVRNHIEFQLSKDPSWNFAPNLVYYFENELIPAKWSWDWKTVPIELWHPSFVSETVSENA